MSEVLIQPTADLIIAGLVEARAALLARVEALDCERSKLLKQVCTLEAGMRVVDPDVRIERRKPIWRVEEPNPNALDEVGRGVLRTMRERAEAMTVPDIVASLMAGRGVPEGDRVHREALRQKVGLYLRKQALKSSKLVRRVKGSDERLPHWEIVPIEEIRDRLAGEAGCCQRL